MDLKTKNIELLKSVLSGLSDNIKNKILSKALQKITKPILLAAENKV
ncbi:hypothetical protein [Gaoshiqia sediminis]|uniref:Uncharacterized protein n=1 Tax=Gaoshiqia sediminis TaxID=2986998 RepID=A0AA41YDG3_9BACT|nr:hypothetical protein [Gaoshiqia sediminis]MCW0484660.1 hypothetical protein [Gaoshiqia sediminis]